VDFNFFVAVDQSEFAELVHEITDAGSDGADHLCQGFLTDVRIDGLRAALLSEIRQMKLGNRCFPRYRGDRAVFHRRRGRDPKPQSFRQPSLKNRSEKPSSPRRSDGMICDLCGVDHRQGMQDRATLAHRRFKAVHNAENRTNTWSRPGLSASGVRPDAVGERGCAPGLKVIPPASGPDMYRPCGPG
jgi:hypothetical protein